MADFSLVFVLNDGGAIRSTLEDPQTDRHLAEDRPMQAMLQAMPDPVIVDLEAGQTSSLTQIEYSKEVEYVIWHRWKPGAWLKVGLQVTSPDDPALAHGYFTSPKLEPGMVYHVAIWEKENDPNQPPNSDIPVRALASIAVFVLRKRPEKRSFFSDENQATGGTYRTHQIATTASVYAYMAVSTNPPLSDNEGYMSFTQIQGAAWRPLSESFVLQIFDLLPGTHYHELVRLSDAFGNWEFIPRDFTTLKRRIKLEPTNLLINDDSDDFSNGEGSFEFKVQTGKAGQPSSWTTRGQLTYSNGNLETGKSVTPPPGGTIVVPVESVTDVMKHVRIYVVGREDDSGSFPADGDDFAWGSKDLFLPAGKTNEVVSQRPDSIYADIGEDLKFTLSFKYWIEYF
jgi:hypothetical protein